MHIKASSTRRSPQGPHSRALVFLALAILAPISLGALSSELTLYTEARGLERVQPDKSCEIFQKLAQSKDFVLRDLAFLRQGLICESPLTEAPVDFATRPWLAQLDLQRKRFTATKKADVLEAVQAGVQLARFEKSQKAILGALGDVDKSLATFKTDAETRTKAKEIIQKVREDVAPRFIERPLPEQWLRIAQDQSNAREFEKARASAQKVLRRPKASFDEKLAARRVIRTSYKLEQKTDSFLAAARGDFKWVQGEKSPGKGHDLGLLYAKALWTDGKVSEAKKVLAEVEKLYGKILRMNEVLFVRGKMAEERKDFRAALAYYDQASLDLKSNLDKKIQFAKAWSQWKLADNDACARELEPLIVLGKDDPFESTRAQFWKARALRRAGKADEAKAAFRETIKIDPLGYYGAITYRELGEKLPPLTVPKVPVGFQKSPLYDAAYFQALFDTNETEVLQAAATEALKSVKPNEATENWLPLFLASAKANSYLPLFSQISALSPEDRATLLQKDPQLLFPLDYKDLIVQQAKKFEVPPELSFSIIRQESAFNTFARSSADAFGLMQILPSVSKSFQKQVGVPVDHFEDLFLPEVNVPYGTALLKDLLKRHDGKVYLVAAAYNASERALKNWLKTRWNGDTVEFIEEVPYEETRAYMKLITRNFTFYARLLHPGEATPFPDSLLGK